MRSSTRLPAISPDIGLVAVRIVVGGFSVYHGAQEIVAVSDFQGLIELLGVPGAALSAWLVVLGEIGLGVLLIVGLGVRLAGVLMAVMFLPIHYTYYVNFYDNSLSLSGLGTLQGVESLSYAATGVFLAFVGAGRLSLDAMLSSSSLVRRVRQLRLGRFLWPEVSGARWSAAAIGTVGLRLFLGLLLVLHSVRRLTAEAGMERLSTQLGDVGFPIPDVVAWAANLTMFGLGLLLLFGLFLRTVGALLIAVSLILFLSISERGDTVLVEGFSHPVGFHGEEFVFLAAAGLYLALTGAGHSPRRRAQDLELISP